MTKRFYKQASVVETDGVFGLALDGKAVKTPAGGALELPTHALADAIAQEWNAQGDDVVPSTMPLMQLASTAIDRVGAVREDVIASIAAYGETDLLCHRDEDGSDLAQRQQEGWQPHLDWLAASHDIALEVGTGILPLPQDAGALEALRRHIESQVGGSDGDMALAGLAELTTLLGSVVLALAVFHGRLEADAAHVLAHLDETFQEERWGADGEAMAARAVRGSEVAAAARFLELLRGVAAA